MASEYLSDQRTLLDAFFHEQDQKLLDAFRDRMEKMDARAQLAEISGIRDEATLDRLVELSIGPETLAAMAVVPLVSVAWADRTIDAKERAVMLKAAQQAGLTPKDGQYPMLEHWLSRRPGPELLDAWKHYIKDLCRRLEPVEVERLKHDLLDRAEEVARAAGGFLGLGERISPAERVLLADLEQAFVA